MIVLGSLLSTNIPAQWGLVPAVSNIALVPQNAPLGNAPPAPPGNNQAPALLPPPPPPPPRRNPVPAQLPPALPQPGNNLAPARLPPHPPLPRRNKAPGGLPPALPPPANNQAPGRLLPLAPPPPPKRNQAQPLILPPRPVVHPAPAGNNQAQPPIIPPRPLFSDPAPLFHLGSSSSDDDCVSSVDDLVSALDDPALRVDDSALPVADPAPAPIGLLPPVNHPMANYMPTCLFFSKLSACFMLSLTNEDHIDWSALFGRPHATLIAYVLPSSHGSGLSAQERAKVNVLADYHELHWRPPHIPGLEFAELDSYDILGVSAMIYKYVPHHRVRYIIGATGEGRRRVPRAPNRPLSFIEYIFIECDEHVRTWLLSNSGLDGPLDLLLYSYCDRHNKRNDMAELRSLPYLGQDAFGHWARNPAAHIGQPNFRALEPNARPTGGQANHGAEGSEDNTLNISSSETVYVSEDNGEEAPADDTSNI